MTTKYSEWAPTSMDTRGLGLEDRQDWHVVGVSQTRDSGCLEQSNFVGVWKHLEDVGVEVHRFGHWGPGWVEILLVPPTSEALAKAQGAEDALSDYPVWDDEDLSDREHEAENAAWESYGHNDFIQALCKAFGLSDTTSEYMSYLDTHALYTSYDCTGGVEHTDEGPRFQFQRVTDGLTQDVLARWLWAGRDEVRKAKKGEV